MQSENYIKQLEALWDMVSDMVEGGRLTEADIPDDYDALVRKMGECEAARAPKDGEVREIGVEECVVVYSTDAEIWTLFTEAEEVGYLGEFDTVKEARDYAKQYYINLKNGS